MQPNRVFAVLILLLAGAFLLQGYRVPALLAAVFGVLVFAASHVRGGRSHDEGVIGDAGASAWSSSDADCSSNDNDNGDGNCETGESGGDSSGDGGGDGGCGGGD